MLQEALSLALAALFRPLDPDRGLIVHKSLYARLGGHRADVGDAEADLLRRIGASRVTVLRAEASSIT